MIGFRLNNYPAKFQVKNIYHSGNIEWGCSRSPGCEMLKKAGLHNGGSTFTKLMEMGVSENIC